MAEIRLDWKNGTLWYNGAKFSPEEITREGVAIPFDVVDLGVKSETDACRELLKRGLANIRDSILTFRGEMPCFRCSVKWGSEHTVATTGTGSLTFVKFSGVRSVRTGVGRGQGAGTKAARQRQRKAKEHDYTNEPEYHRQFDD